MWVAAIAGKIGEPTHEGFILEQPNIQVFEKKPKEPKPETEQTTQSGSNKILYFIGKYIAHLENTLMFIAEYFLNLIKPNEHKGNNEIDYYDSIHMGFAVFLLISKCTHTQKYCYLFYTR